MDKAIEAAARAVMLARPNGGCIVQDWEREARDNPHVETALKQAQAAIAAYRAQREADGFVECPVEPDLEAEGAACYLMRDRGIAITLDDARDIYRLMATGKQPEPRGLAWTVAARPQNGEG